MKSDDNPMDDILRTQGKSMNRDDIPMHEILRMQGKIINDVLVRQDLSAEMRMKIDILVITYFDMHTRVCGLNCVKDTTMIDVVQRHAELENLGRVDAFMDTVARGSASAST